MDVELSEAELERYRTQLSWQGLGARGQEQLKQARVLVVGAGPVGAGIAGQLASSGIGYLGIVDQETVTRGDLAGQTVHFSPDIGSIKADSVAGKLGVLNPDVQVDPYPVAIDADNAEAIVIGHDVVVSSIRDREARLQLNDACVRAGIAMVDCVAAGGRLEIQTVGEQGGSCLRCEGVAEIAQAGIAPGLTGLAAAIAAREALRMLLAPAPTEQRTFFDADAGLFEQTEIQCRDGCPTCSAAAPVGEPAG